MNTDEPTASLVAVTFLAAALALATLCGCQGTRSKAIVETKVPDIWAAEGVAQSVSVKIELTR